jgi:hypothetical protein
MWKVRPMPWGGRSSAMVMGQASRTRGGTGMGTPVSRSQLYQALDWGSAAICSTAGRIPAARQARV